MLQALHMKINIALFFAIVLAWGGAKEGNTGRRCLHFSRQAHWMNFVAWDLQYRIRKLNAIKKVKGTEWKSLDWNGEVVEAFSEFFRNLQGRQNQIEQEGNKSLNIWFAYWVYYHYYSKKKHQAAEGRFLEIRYPTRHFKKSLKLKRFENTWNSRITRWKSNIQCHKEIIKEWTTKLIQTYYLIL